MTILSNVSEQLTLFNVQPSLRVEQPKKLMSKDAVLKWKLKIFDYQQRTLQTEPPKQTSLFDAPKSHCDSDSINPFKLQLHSSQFYRMREQGDHEVPGFA